MRLAPFRSLIGAVLAVGLAVPAMSQTLSEREARNQVAKPRGVTVVVEELSFVSDAVEREIERVARDFPYYAAIAVSPGDAGAMAPMANLHSPQDAARAALSVCNARRTTGSDCVIVARVLPRGYKAGDLTLSVEATRELNGAFRRLDSPKAFAISSATGHFAFARGDGARAMANCNALTNGANDCRIAVADR